jgi:hypothetical protein
MEGTRRQAYVLERFAGGGVGDATDGCEDDDSALSRSCLGSWRDSSLRLVSCSPPTAAAGDVDALVPRPPAETRTTGSVSGYTIVLILIASKVVSVRNSCINVSRTGSVSSYTIVVILTASIVVSLISILVTFIIYFLVIFMYCIQ